MYWKKLRVLGVGSYSTVYLVATAPLVEYSSPFTLFAVAKSAEADATSSSLREEGQILHALRGSDHVVKCFGEDVSLENGKRTYNLLLEYAAGGTLHDLIQKKSLGETEAAHYAFQILAGICHVHRKGFIHCDLKPANILVFPRGHHLADLKLADFGLSLKLDETYTCWDRSFDSMKHRHDRIRGTLLYAPPESVVHGIHDKGNDIWALGCIVVEMITGRQLWSGCKSSDELKLKIAHEEPEIPDNISNVAKDFIGKCLDHNWRWNAEMLLTHPFIKNNANKKMIDELIHQPSGHPDCKSLISVEHLFSTIP